MSQESEERLLDPNTVKQAEDLLQTLKDGDVTKARDYISKLNGLLEDGLYIELGKLTRDLHETLKAINVGLKGEDMPDAKNKLTQVIELTENAANTTMDGIEKTMPISDALAKEAHGLLDEWSKLKRRELTVQQFKDLYKEMMDFLSSVDNKAGEIHQNLQDVLVAQNYQDLSGQAIKKVMEVVAKLEDRLVELIRIASEAGQDFGELEDFSLGGEEAVEEDEGQKKVKSQNEVDDLLSSLGF